MPDTLAPVKGIVREKNANVDVNIIRRDRAILYRIQPRKAAIIRSEAIQWRRPVTKVDELINVVLHLHDSEISEPSKKYQLRTAASTGSSRIQSLRDTSPPHTPAPPAPRTAPGTSGSGGASQTMRSIGTQTNYSLEKADNIDAGRDKPPCPVQRPGSSLGNHSVTYHPRSASCQPPHLYQHSNNQQKQARARSADRTKSTPKRFDGSPVEIPGFMRNNGSLHHEELSLGQKQYIWGVARIYSVTQLMKLKQRQYQSLLDYEFSRRIQNKDLKEHERLREWKEYLRYSKFIKCYEQRIPRCKSRGMRSPCEEASHIHKHMIKGWTTDSSANDAYRRLSRTSINNASFQPASSPTERGETGYEQSTDEETEHYELKLVILPGDREKSQSDNVSETDLKETSEEEKRGQQSKNLAAHVHSGNSLKVVEDTKEAEPSTVEGNFI